MEESRVATIHPVGVFAGAVSVWFKNLIQVAALYSINILLLKILHLSRNVCGLEPPAVANAGPKLATVPAGWSGRPELATGHAGCVSMPLAMIFVFEVLVILVLNAFLCLLILNYFKACSKGRVSFGEVFSETRKAIPFYLKAIFLLLVFVTVVLGTGFVFYWAGYGFYAGAAAAGQGLKMAVLLLASTLCVGFVIAAFWYGFFFSLGPLVAAFEKKQPWVAMVESRSRIKGRALKYLFALFLCALVYFVVGLAAYAVLTSVTRDKFILELLDPAMATLFGPLWLATWLASYERLKELKQA